MGAAHDNPRYVTLDATAVALSAFRVLPNDRGSRQYTATTFPRDPLAGCEQFIRQCRAFGYLRPEESIAEDYAVLDVLNADGDIVQDFGIPTATAFQYIKRKLKLQVLPEVPF